MIDMQIKSAAEEFVSILCSSEVMKQFLTAQQHFNTDSEVVKQRKEFAALSRELQQKQFSTPLTQEEMDRYKSAQQALNSHPAVRQYTQSRKELVEILNSCNECISEIIGINFADTTAAPASCSC